MIEARDLHKSFGDQPVLEGVNLHIETGEAVVIIGRSGGGKSVLLKLLIGLLRPDSGDVRIDGESLRGMKERDLLRVRSNFGMLFQSAALFDSMSVAENIGFALEQSGRFTQKETATKVAEALEMVELAGVERKRPAELSGGMRKRVGLARAIVYGPRVILYDEPTTGLDPIVSDTIDQLIVRVCERLKVTSVAVTHDMRSAARIGKRIVMLHEGRIHAGGTPEEIFNSRDPVVSRFVKGISDLRETPIQP
ncbi:MAG: phospholipid/cholesterol/gamma-HCH transport system ATP-binding protein [Verrucomicrobiota bacterium]|jgi:phospholipid/cholesterol/gamma-HCH transport system ATP-binding protein